MPRLRRSDCTAPGIVRRRRGKGFVYLGPDGERVDDPAVLARIQALAIPPAWQDVWICPWPFGHIQAMGTDARGRRQYRYHDLWRQRRDAEKFDHMLEFAAALPGLRETIAAHLERPDLDRLRVLACATRLLDLGFFRIGTEGYAEENNTFGLATMRKEHVTLQNGTVTFEYTAKSGKHRVQSVVDPDVYEIVGTLKRRRSGGPELLAYRDGGAWVDIKSTDINTYLKDVAGADFTAKDFRTWSATVLAAVALAVSARVSSESGKKRAVTRAMKEVAHYLGNTPAVARGSYVDPRVVDRFREGVTIAPMLGRLGEGASFGQLSTQGAIEAAVLELLGGAAADVAELAEAV